MDLKAKPYPVLSMLMVIAFLWFSACGGAGGDGMGSSKAYTIGGTVSGLVGSGLVLQDNGGDNLAVKANGTFEFKSHVASGGTYDVTVLTQPAGPEQTCRVINYSGKVTSDVTGIGVRCADNPTPGSYLFEEGQTSLLNLATVEPNTGALSSPILSNEATSGLWPNIVVTPNQLYLYALFASFGEIKGYVIGGPGLRLSPIEGSPFSSPRSDSGGINNEVQHPSGRFLYVVESPGKIEQYSIDAAGILTSNSLITEERTDFYMAVIDPTGKFLVAPGGYSGVFVYAINQSSGTLSPISTSPFTMPGGESLDQIIMEKNGRYFYTPLSSGGIAAFALNSSTGVLADVPGSPFFRTKSLTCIAADPAGRFIYTCNRDGSIDGFEIDEDTGTLNELAGYPVVTPSLLTSIVVDPGGSFIYTASMPESLIYGFGVNGSTGEISPLAGSPFPSVANPTGLFAINIQ